MDSASGTTIPGARIGDYRNSSPRLIRLLGLGEKGSKVARIVARRGLPNVEILTDAKPVGWKEVANDRAGAGTNMIVIVCAEGDERLFCPEQGKPDMLVTFVLLQSSGDLNAAGERRLTNARAFSDLFVTTSDIDYVSELIDNLASKREAWMPGIRNIARERLERGELSLGVGIRVVRTIEIAKAMMSTGYDWLFIDLEHGALSIETASQIAVAALDAGITPIVRIPNGEFSIATRLLDNGALGIVVPHVETAEEARVIVEKLRYPPQGRRAVFSSVPQLDFKPMKAADMAALNAATLITVMLESPQAIENAPTIAAVPGIDVLLIGTNDLCLEMGIPGDLGHAKVDAAYDRMIAACRTHGKWSGMGGIYDEQLMRRYIDMGARFILAGGDLGFLLGAAAERAGFLRGIHRQ